MGGGVGRLRSREKYWKEELGGGVGRLRSREKY